MNKVQRFLFNSSLYTLTICTSFFSYQNPSLSATLTGASSTLNSVGIVNDFDNISLIIESVLKIWDIIEPEGRPLRASDFSTIKSARLLVACVNGNCKHQQEQSNEKISIAKRTITKTGDVKSKASVSGALTQTFLNNPACAGDAFRPGIAAIMCEIEADAVGRPGEIFVKDVTASAFGLVYDGEDGILFMSGVEDIDQVYRSVPEVSSIFSFLAFGTLGAASTLKRKLKPSKPADKKLEKAS
ncbi:hypothetical protein ACP6PL_00115 [Dapis sp. BLCC M126]|uniref:hypothetical protein n=1 Tax=Dapis sp. BLCC M126 TaxID=3400189 RepID=UPI003CEE2494